jgi:hypothetical protein
MPQRAQPDRIARYGQGFSKLLSNLQYQQLEEQNAVNFMQSSIDNKTEKPNTGFPRSNFTSPSKEINTIEKLNATTSNFGKKGSAKIPV